MDGTLPISRATVPAAATAPKTRWRRVLTDRRVDVGLALVVPFVGIALFGRFLAPHNPNAFVGLPFTGPAPGIPFGTDNLGRDVFSRFLAGGWSLLWLATLATVVGVLSGALLACIIAYVRGWVGEAAMRLADVLLAFPPIVLALMLLSLLGPKMWILLLVVAVGHFPRTLRVVHASALGVVDRDFVRYDVALGVKALHMVRREILPNVVAPIMVELGIRFIYSIGTVAGLSFLGVGIQPPTADWGRMVNENRVGLTVQPWGVVLPVIAIAVLAIGSNLIVDGVSRVVSGLEAQRPG
jgi:peptide/nickel transport system permease protein